MAILRFMLTYETCWKALKWTLLEDIGIEVNGPKPAFQEAFAQGWLGESMDVWLQMIADRNLIVHTYNETQAEGLFEHLADYLHAFKALKLG
jgi:nucleotidyltransferase substrate binding protein (TIGR01987 family)